VLLRADGNRSARRQRQELWSRPSSLHRVARRTPTAHRHAYHFHVALRPGIEWVVQVKYVDAGRLRSSRSPRRTIIV